MKKIVILFIIPTLFMSCMSSWGVLKVKNDEFKGITLVTLKQYIWSKDDDQTSHYCEFNFVKEIKNNKARKIQLYFTINMAQSDPDLTKDVYIMQDDKSVKVKWTDGSYAYYNINPQGEYVPFSQYVIDGRAVEFSVVPVKFVDYTKQDSSSNRDRGTSSYVDYTKKHSHDKDDDSKGGDTYIIDTTKYIKGFINIDAAIYEKFDTMEEFKIRFYSGFSTMTFDFYDKYLTLLADFKNTDSAVEE